MNAYIYGVNGQYIISIREMNRETAIRTIAHELIHMEQHESGRSYYIEGGYVYDGKTYLKDKLDEYIDRPWEIEAFVRQYSLAKKIKARLYDE